MAAVALPAQANPLEEAERLAAAGDHQTAMQRFEEVLRAIPGNERARAGEVASAEAVALAARRTGDNETCLGVLLQAREAAPHQPRLLYDFGVQAEGMKLYRDAEAALTEAAKLRPDDVDISYALARVKIDLGDLPEGERLLRVYVGKRPEDASAHYGLGLVEHQLLRDDEARTEFARSLELAPAQTESHYQLGQIAMSRGESAEARVQFGAVLARAPQHAGALAGMGQMELREKNFAGARDHLQAAVKAAPEYAEAHRSLALALTRLGDTAGAKQQLEEAERLAAEQQRTGKGYTLQKP